MSRELPILFNSEMVRAILDGRKSCTRRLVKTRRKDACGFYVTRKKTDGTFAGIYEYDENESMFDNPLEPLYQPGDILYVRETWCKGLERYIYRADYSDTEKFYRDGKEIEMKWHPSIRMPKEAARIWLRVTNVRVERLQEITEAGAIKEGCVYDVEYALGNTAKGHFKKLWDSTIKKSDLDTYGWDVNPYVFVIEFEQCEKPEEN